MKKKSRSRLIKSNFSLICYAVALLFFLIITHPLFYRLIGNNQNIAWFVKNYYPTVLLLLLAILFLIAGVAIKPSKLNLCLLLILIIFIATLKFGLQNLEQPTISYWDYIESFLIAIFWYLVMLERVNQIWDMALSSISLNNTNKYNRILDKNDILKNYSLVGEFYDSDTLVNFFIQKHDSIIKLLQQYSLDINYEITDNFKHKNLELYDDQIKENCFYLIPINSNRGWGKNKNNMHWICYKKCDKNLVIFNSGDEVTEKRAKRNAALCKSTIRSKYILNTYELLEVWKNMYNRETDYRNEKNLELYFDFYK